mgnify:CR=1 FL=1
MKRITDLIKINNKEKVEKVISKLIFPVEFILSIITIIFLYKFLCLNKYENIVSAGYITGFMITGIMVIGLIIYNYIKNKDKIEKVFLSFMIPVGLLYLIFMIPSYVPDEYAHIWKAYQVSEGVIFTPIDEQGNSHTEVPEFFKTSIIGYINKYSDMNKAISEKTDYNNKVEVETTAQNYPPFLYLFSSIGLFISRVIGLNGLLAQYVARMLNFIVFLILSYYSIKIIPFGKLLVSCFLFIPMVLQQAASISGDSLVNATCIFFTAYNLYLLFKKDKITRKEQIAYILLSIFIGIAKVVYIPLVGLSMLLIGSKNLDKKNKTILITTSIILGCIISVAWYIFSIQYKGNVAYLEMNNVNGGEQIKNLIKYPVHLITVIVRTLQSQGTAYLFMMMGANLGWLEINIPTLTIIGFMILVVLSIFFENNKVELNWKQKTWTILMFLFAVVLVLLALYVSWTPVGADQVQGVQGRYFLPVILLPLICFSQKENYVRIKNVNLIMMTLLSLLNFYVVSKIVLFFL